MFLLKKQFIFFAVVIVIILIIVWRLSTVKKIGISSNSIEVTSRQAAIGTLLYQNGMKRDETILFQKDGKKWKTYKNYLYGYEVSAPVEWDIKDNSMLQSTQSPRVDLTSPTLFNLPGAPRGAKYTIMLLFSAQNESNRKISTNVDEFEKLYELGDQAVNPVDMTKAQLEKTKEFKLAQEIIPTAKYLYSIEDARSFVESIPSPTPMVISAPKSVPLEKWKTYSDPQLLFSFRYPPGWTIGRMSGPDGFNAGKDGSVPVLVRTMLVGIVDAGGVINSVSVYKSSLLPQKWYENFFEEGAGPVLEKKESVVNGHPTFYVRENNAPEGNTTRYIVSHKGYVFVFKITDGWSSANNDGVPLTINLKSALPDFKKMVDSLSFGE